MTEQDLKNAFPKPLPDRPTWRCPDDARLAAYVDHRLIGRDQSRLERHLAGCGYCLGQVAALTRLQDVPLPADIPVNAVVRARELAPGKAAATLRVTQHRKLPGGVNWFRYRVRY